MIRSQCIKDTTQYGRDTDYYSPSSSSCSTSSISSSPSPSSSSSSVKPSSVLLMVATRVSPHSTKPTIGGRGVVAKASRGHVRGLVRVRKIRRGSYGGLRCVLSPGGNWWGHPHGRRAWRWGHSSWESTRGDRRGHQISLGNSPRKSRGSPRRGNSGSGSQWSKAWGLDGRCVVTNPSLSGGLSLHGRLCGWSYRRRWVLRGILTDSCSRLAVRRRSGVLRGGRELSRRLRLLGIGPSRLGRLGIGKRGSILVAGGSVSHRCRITGSSLEKREVGRTHYILSTFLQTQMPQNQSLST